ncbi:MAG: hypothetical protein ISS13_02840 [Actinobacteria bacterium]|nr:hypothetical protein [Actinomycetota bacterium]MBL7060755.1 hypothetical protein [Actinomycetota bacterium]
MLLAKGLITERVVELIFSWRHSGFGVYCRKRINPKEARPPRINTSSDEFDDYILI